MKEKSIKGRISVWAVLYFVLVIALLIGCNVFSFVQGKREAQRSSELDKIKPHNNGYSASLLKNTDMENRPKKVGKIYNGMIINMNGFSSGGESAYLSEFRKEQIKSEFSKVTLKIAGKDGTALYYIDERTVFEIEKTGKTADAFKVGDEISFEYALFDKDDILIIGFYDGNVPIEEPKAEDECDDELYAVTTRDIFSYALIDLVPLLFFFVLFLFLVFLIRDNKKGPAKIAMIIVCVSLALFFVFILFGTYSQKAKAAAPVIYLYPENETAVNVSLSLKGELTTSYPVYDQDRGWDVKAYPDGTLIDKNGRKYPFLFWEGEITIRPDLDHGFCVKGKDTAEFLETALKQLGLTDDEAGTFIMYWLPQMENNRYNVISFQTKAYEDAVAHKISPEPDTVITVNMLWYPSGSFVRIEPQDLTSLNPSERKGFTVVEWGGEKYRKAFPVHVG